MKLHMTKWLKEYNKFQFPAYFAFRLNSQFQFMIVLFGNNSILQILTQANVLLRN